MSPLSRFADVDEPISSSSPTPHLHFRALVEACPQGVFLLDTSGACVYANSAAGRLLGYDAEQLVGRDMHTLLHHSRSDGTSYPRGECPIYGAATCGTACDVTDEILWRADGTSMPVTYRGRPLHGDGCVAGAVVTFTDSTEQQAHLAQVLGILETAGDAFIGIDGGGRVTGWNRAASTLLGWTAEEAAGGSVVDLLAPGRGRGRSLRMLRELREAPDHHFPQGPLEALVRHKDGREITTEVTVGRLRAAGQHLYHFFLRDVTERQATGRLLEESEALHRLLTEQSTDLISRHGPDGRFRYVSPASHPLLGIAPEDLVGRSVQELVHVDDLANLPDFFTPDADSADRAEVTVRLRHGDGHWVWVEAVLTALRTEDGTIEVQAHTRDITGRHVREAELQQASRLDSLGRLAAGLAHEINTPIQFVGDNTRFLAESCEDLVGLVLAYRELLGSSEALSLAELRNRAQQAEAQVDFDYLHAEIPSAIAQTLEGVDRVSTIVRAMRTFSDPSQAQQVYADLNAALNAAMIVVRHRIDSVAEVRVDFADLPPIQFNATDVNQAFLNLLMNAVDAIEETGQRGTISVATSVDDGYVSVAVGDTGPGIPEDVLPKIFDPFFTTKAVGRGVGQGLVLARAIVQDGHGGTLLVASQPGEGSTFTIRLPIDGPPSSE